MTESQRRIGCIWSYIFRSDDPPERKVLVLGNMLLKFPEESPVHEHAGRLKTIIEDSQEVPSIEIMEEFGDFLFNLNEITIVPRYSDVCLLIDEESRNQAKSLFITEITDTIDKIGDTSVNDVADKMSEALKGLLKPTGNQYIEPVRPSVHYEETRENPAGALSFITPIDDVLKGIEPGNLMTVMGFVGSFKTTFGVNFAYNNALLGYNVAFLTLEVPKEYLQYMTLSRHSYNPIFAEHGDPVAHEDLRKHSLTKEQESFVFNVVEPDLYGNSSYGKIHFLELYDFDDISYEAMKSFMGSLPTAIDIFIVDYVQLFQYYQNRRIRLDNVTSMIDFFVRQFQMTCQNFNGRKLMGLLLSQMNRAGYSRAVENNGRADLLALSESRELERSSFAVMSLFTDDALRESGEVKTCLLKNRGGDIIVDPLITRVDPRYCVIGDDLSSFEDNAEFDSSSMMQSFGGGY